MRRLAIIVAAVVLSVGLGASAQPADAVSVARGLIDAENSHNVSAAVNFFAPGAIVNLPTGSFVTRAEIEQWQQELAAGNFHATTTAPVAVTPEVVTFSGSVSLDLFRSLGLSSLDSTWQLTIQLGRITTFTFDFTPAATARLRAAIGGAGGGGGVETATPAPAAAATSSSAPAPAAQPARATPAAATSGTLALTGVSLRPVAVGGVSILAGLLMLGLARPRRRLPAVG